MEGANPKVDFFFNEASQWQTAFGELRAICLDCKLEENLKWGQACYSLADGTNIVLIHGFKEYCALLFFKGVLLKDPGGLLIQQTENVQAARQMRFTNVHQITELKTTIKAYIFEEIEVEKAGFKVEMKKTEDFCMPEEFEAKLASDAKLKAAFEALTPGRQRGYLFYFSQAKQSKTRVERIEKLAPKIMAGKGFSD
jgi:uncharacterized protein YdeI (YjbR/CyaY-like superfamily)